MKKLLALLLAAVMCLSLVACGGSEKNEILGKWKTVTGESIEFYKDGTTDGGSTWKYDKELQTFVVSSTIPFHIKIKTENDIRYFSVYGTNYYFIDDYEKGLQVEREAAQNEINSYIAGRTKIEIGKSYDYAEGITIAFLGASIVEEDDTCRVYIDAAFTNESGVKRQFPNLDYNTYFIRDDVDFSYYGEYQIYWGYEGDASKIEPGATVEKGESVLSVLDADHDFRDSLSAIICCFEINGTEYYIDLSEYIK